MHPQHGEELGKDIFRDAIGECARKKLIELSLGVHCGEMCTVEGQWALKVQTRARRVRPCR